MNYKSFNLGDWIGHISGVIEDESELDGNEMRDLVEFLSGLPKTGHWIKVTNGRGGHECDICHVYAPSYKNGDEWLTKYCPNCGAKMVELQESEVKE